MPGRSKLTWLVRASLLALSLPVLANDGDSVATLQWNSDGPADVTELSIAFGKTPPRFEVDLSGGGVAVWLEGVDPGMVTLEGVSVTSTAGGARMELTQPGVRLHGVRMTGNRLILEIQRGTADNERAAPSYRIGIGDVVTLLVYKNPDLSGDLTVAPDGSVSVPLVGIVAAAGRTEAQLTHEIRRILEKDYLVDPQISVSVKTYQSQFVYVTGSVPRSTRVALRPGMILKDVLSEAGVALTPGQEVVVSRAGSSGEKISLNSAELQSSSAPDLRDGDVVTVRDPRYVFLQGEVRRPQRILLSGEMTLLQAISLCEGLTDWASKRDIRIRRKKGDGTEEIRINLKDVQRGHSPDPVLEPEDVVIVERRIL